ncbi:M15 family metallopeptidase [Desulfogranum japonicum]|uniref:M15 family metallopeptidase n=1 Tax=Desulfogranum japonicum TaxID=231447 RepID=UPI000685C772|nr:M15 family metallopeptidase [Desulfogranum japonicum]
MSKYPIGLLSCVLLLLFQVNSVLGNEIEEKFIMAGLVNVADIDSSIQVDLVNSDPGKNFFHEDYYNGLQKAYLRKEVAEKLSMAQKLVKAKYPGYSLQILDAARPRSVSQAMYDKMKGTPFERYVAHPQKGSMHNYGIAVDITVVDERGVELDMGPTPFKKTRVELYWQYAKKKIGIEISAKQSTNRKLLAEIMQQAGFIPLGFEWWLFNGLDKQTTRRTYPIIE